MNTLLIEILTEELPPKNLESFGLSFSNLIIKKIESFLNKKSSFSTITTPRRFGIIIENINTREADKSILKKGPTALRSDLEQITPQLQGFMNSNGIEKLSDLTIKDNYYYANITIKGQNLEEIIINIINETLKQIPINKHMFWGNNKGPFIRPIHNIMLMINDTVVNNGNIFDLTPNNTTFGHRNLSKNKIIIKNPLSYKKQMLDEGFVMVDFNDRQNFIKNELVKQAKNLNLFLDLDYSLLNEVTAITEYPVIIKGEFNKEFLKIPKECLILTMNKHQKYFALHIDEKQECLSNQFLFVANNLENKVIIEGNEQVLTARLVDAKFFYEIDKKYGLSYFANKLSTVIYQQKLGTLENRVKRLTQIAIKIGSKLNLDEKTIYNTTTIMKADLVSQMVFEFPELQGTMGKYYALNDGLSNEIAISIYEQYLPRFKNDKLPSTKLGALLALVDKIENIYGVWLVGLIPSGDKDPFALRRAGIGIVRILLNLDISILDLLEICNETFNSDKALELNSEDSEKIIQEVYQFILDRLSNFLIEELNYNKIYVNATLDVKPLKFNYLISLLDELKGFTLNKNNEKIIIANKRIENILKKNNINLNLNQNIDENLINTSYEKALYLTYNKYKDEISKLYNNQNWNEYFNILSLFNDSLNNYFDNVLIMSEDESIKNNRINLLKNLYNCFNLSCRLSQLTTTN